MQANTEKGRQVSGILLIVVYLISIYWVFNREDFIEVSKWGDYFLLIAYYLVAGMGLLASVYNLNNPDLKHSQWLWYLVFMIAVLFIAALSYGIYIEHK